MCYYYYQMGRYLIQPMEKTFNFIPKMFKKYVFYKNILYYYIHNGRGSQRDTLQNLTARAVLIMRLVIIPLFYQKIINKS